MLLPHHPLRPYLYPVSLALVILVPLMKYQLRKFWQKVHFCIPILSTLKLLPYTITPICTDGTVNWRWGGRSRRKSVAPAPTQLSSLGACNMPPDSLTFDQDDNKWRLLGNFLIFVCSTGNWKKTHGRVSGLDTQFFAHILASRLKFENRQGDATSIIKTYMSLNF